MCSFEGIWKNRYLEKECSSIAQSVEHAAVNRSVVGSSPTGGAFLKKMRLRGQAVKTSPFHGGNTGSIPVGVTKKCLHIFNICECNILYMAP